MSFLSSESMPGCAQTTTSRNNFIEHPLFPFLALLRINYLGPKKYHLCFESLCREGLAFFGNRALHAELGLGENIRESLASLYKDLQQAPTIETNTIIQGAIDDLIWENHINNHIVLLNNDCFPKQLKEIYDCPPLLFVTGNLELLNRRQLAMVGSRRPSREGCLNARAFSKHLVNEGWVVTSGLASGIDTFSHEGALLSGKASTIAVLAHGLNAVYPKRNQQLAKNIIENQGALVSEFPVGVLPRPEFFPKRNRIISGLAMGVLVVEAACKSGSLITAYSALEQNRDVFAIPGSIHNPMSKGCHELIRQGANLVESSHDINEHYQWHREKNQKTVKISVEKLSGEELAVLKVIQHEELTANEIATLLNKAINDVSSLLMLMEMKNILTQGNRGFLKSKKFEESGEVFSE